MQLEKSDKIWTTLVILWKMDFFYSPIYSPTIDPISKPPKKASDKCIAKGLIISPKKLTELIAPFTADNRYISAGVIKHVRTEIN